MSPLERSMVLNLNPDAKAKVAFLDIVAGVFASTVCAFRTAGLGYLWKKTLVELRCGHKIPLTNSIWHVEEYFLLGRNCEWLGVCRLEKNACGEDDEAARCLAWMSRRIALGRFRPCTFLDVKSPYKSFIPECLHAPVVALFCCSCAIAQTNQYR